MQTPNGLSNNRETNANATFLHENHFVYFIELLNDLFVSRVYPGLNLDEKSYHEPLVLYVIPGKVGVAIPCLLCNDEQVLELE